LAHPPPRSWYRQVATECWPLAQGAFQEKLQAAPSHLQGFLFILFIYFPTLIIRIEDDSNNSDDNN
jgi:hypothetical protein